MQLSISICLATLVSLAALPAQVVVPDGLTKDGNSTGTLIGIYPSARVQLIEASIYRAITIRRVGFRRDGSLSYDMFSGQGRTWNPVTLDVSIADVTQVSSTFSSNLKGKVVRVFYSRVSWPTWTGQSKVSPVPWDSGLSFGFSKPLVATGSSALLLDWTFQSGVLANQASWTASVNYSFDGHAESRPATKVGAVRYFPPRSKLHCGDSGHVIPGMTHAEVRAHADHAINGPLSGKLVGTINSLGTAQNQWVVHLAGLSGSPQGTNLGAGCNQLHVYSSLPYLWFVRTTDRASFAETQVVLPEGITGLTGWAQSAWMDSKTLEWKLTGACSFSAPSKPRNPLVRFFVHASSATANTGTVADYDSTPWYFPVTQFSSK